MFNKDFYPTPESVIAQMTWDLDLNNKVVLEPSAGKGDIVDFCQNSGANVIACELNSDLKTILKSKCKVISDDFLKVTSDMVSHIDYIIMNPPFSADEKHILHAWDIAPEGCAIIALCNYETLSNAKYSYRQELTSIIKDYGNSENLGDVFSSAERKTDVEIGLVKLYKPRTKSETEFEGFFMEEDEEEQYIGLQQYNFVRDCVNRYVGAVKIFDKQLESANLMNDLTGSFFSSSLALSMTRDKAEMTREDYKKDLQKSAWKYIFGKMNMHRYSTKGLREDINLFVEKQTKVPFTMRNVYRMIEIVVGTQSQRMDKALLEVFNKLTEHYHENRYGVEGWKTNSHYLVNQKFIMPYIAPQSKWGSYPDVNDRQSEIVDDFVKALCYLTGQSWIPENCFRIAVNRRDKPLEYGQWFDFQFFEVKLFKKGTGHFKFKDRDIWATFNQHIARIKGYPLPEAIQPKNK
ncbi:DNA methyltransferase [Elizabethkingia anophelis]|nr:DNA methyltransferase [Elizabethkingia anophelis]